MESSKKQSTNTDAEKIAHMLELAELVKEITRVAQPTKGNKELTKHPVIRPANRIVDGLKAANCVIESYLKPYRLDIYPKNKEIILKKKEDPEWMTDVLITAYLGDPKLKACLCISMAMNTAFKLRKAIETKYKNVNDREEALLGVHGTYPYLLYLKFLIVVCDAIGQDHRDISRLSNIIEKLKDMLPGMSDNSDSDSESSDGPSLGRTVSGIAGEKKSTKDIERTVSGIIGNKDSIDKMKDVMQRLNKGGNPLENTDLIVEAVTEVGPMFKDMFENMTKNMNNEDDSEESSSSG